MVKNPAAQDPGPTVAAAIELLIRQGYDSTPVEELADAAGISRSTFFRKFGSKEDMVFADHERILARVEADLGDSTVDPLTAVAEAARMVFDQHVRNRETSLLRNQLLHQVPALRDRELVTTHRYERSFRRHLQSTLPEADREYATVAFAAGVVAVHNRVLRHWLQDAERGSDDRLDRTMASRLGRELRAVVNIFRPALFPSAVPEPRRPAVLVTVLEPGVATEEILEAVREALA
ncbi:helix-turn-helix domain-containing protein [Arthrobacter sp. UYEF20]|uniref:TetR/AcrR family transcriptional regulator n=1 Tax=Arthrobacter sp. UYEF20 TaxID=1756363 RepID=UPI00339AE590